jgi:hypothetical protein
MLQAGTSTAAASVLIAWIRQRKLHLKLKINRQDGSCIEADIRNLDSRGDEFVRDLVQALEGGASVEIKPRDEQPPTPASSDRQQPD